MRFPLFCVSLTVATALACTSHTEAPQSVDSTSVPATAAGDSLTGGSLLPLRVLVTEFSSGITDSTRAVLADSAAWADTYARIYMNHGRPPSVSNVDFTRDVVVLAALGTRSSGGYSITIDSARTTSAGVVVHVHSTSPGPSCMTTAALTQPVHAVAMPRTVLPVQFVEHSTVNNCD